MHVIIYKNDSGNIAVVYPTTEILQTRTVMEVAIKDVPAGKPFKIIDSSELPDAPQEAWEIDDAELSDGVGGESNEFN